MRILVMGAGVLGCNLADSFAHSKKDVTLLARGQWAEEIRKNGLRIKNQLFPHTSVTRLPVITELKPNDAYDVIFVCVRFTQIASVVDALNENQSKNIVFVGNNTRPKETASSLKGKNVMFAFYSAAGHREKNKVVSLNLKKITIGQLSSSPSYERLINEIFQDTGHKVKYEQNMGDYLLCHAAFVLPLAFACYKTKGNLKKVKRDKAYLNKVLDAIIEAYDAIRKAGHELLPDSEKDYQSPEYQKENLRFFKFLCGTFLGKICVSDHAMNAVDEMSALNSDMERFFQEHDAECPNWDELSKCSFLNGTKQNS